MGHKSAVDCLVLALDLHNDPIRKGRDIATGVLTSHNRDLLQVVVPCALGRQPDCRIPVIVSMRVILGSCAMSVGFGMTIPSAYQPACPSQRDAELSQLHVLSVQR